MQLNHSFTVDLEPQRTFDLLLDVPRIATCMPGATLTSVDGDSFGGSVKVKLGPVVMTYNGKARIVERNRDDLRAKIELSGRDTKGSSDASATVDTVLVASGEGTEVRLLTDLAVTGKPAQLGRGLMNDVGRKLIGQFADSLAKDIEASKNPPAAAPAEVPGVRRPAAESEPIDLLEVAGLPTKKMLAAGAVLVGVLLLLLRRHNRS
jgi:carbon monoxide dehydrogenase subunit G